MPAPIILYRLAILSSIILLSIEVSACHALASGRVTAPAASAPYSHSRVITAVTWNFSAVAESRRAEGSDLWPCTWARDDNLYCAWGDGGGFDGNDNNIGRASAGFARISGMPIADGFAGFSGKNVWGGLPYAEKAATFGGKIDSLISVGGVLYASSGLWMAHDTADPLHSSGRGPVNTLAWSSDLGITWQIAPWSSGSPIGTFLNFGRDNAGAFDSNIYIYYLRDGDSKHIYLKRVLSSQLQSDPATSGIYEYFTADKAHRQSSFWSKREEDASAVFFDPNNVVGPQVVYNDKLHRFILALGHYASGDEREASIGQLGLFEARRPWGPWATIAYYDDWGKFGLSSAGDFLGLQIPTKWISSDGKTVWCVFSGLDGLDSFNLIEGKLTTSSLLRN